MESRSKAEVKQPLVRLPAHLPGELWGVATYFNPAGYSNKLALARTFSRRVRGQGLKLLIVELTFGNKDHELTEDLADKIVRVRSDCVLWQKERLLNIAIEDLPEACDKVAWLDADVLLGNDKWVEETYTLLEQYAVVQPYDLAIWLPQDCQTVSIDDRAADTNDRTHGAVYGHIHKPTPPLISGHTGFAWAARRNLLLKHGLHDRLICTSGDVIISLAMFGYFRYLSSQQLLAALCSPGLVEDILRWSTSFYSDMQGSVAYVNGRIFHLWHGDMEDRHYAQAQLILRRNGFDPRTDIDLDSNRCWRWASNKSELHDQVRNYFWQRNEEAPGPKLYDQHTLRV